jgi:flagellar motor switch protein FliN
MEDQQRQKIAASFATKIAESLSEAMTTITGSPSPLEVLHSPATPTPKTNPIQRQLSLEGALNGECFIEFYEPHASEIVRQISKQAADDSANDPSEVLLRILGAAAEKLSSSLVEHYGATKVTVDRSSGLAFGGMVVFPIAGPEDSTAPQIWLYLGGGLLDEFVSTGTSPSKTTSEKASQAANLKLVMDVELNVSLRFGQREMPLREVLELGNGSLVELDHLVDEPVELFLDGKLIARGEAVIVDGNYGLRITEIPQPVESYFLN